MAAGIEEKKQTETPKKKKWVGIFLALAVLVTVTGSIVTQVIVPDKKFYETLDLMEVGSYAKTIAASESLDGTMDSTKKTVAQNEIHIKEELSAAKTGDLVTFGTYEQDNNISNGAEAIQWRVLAKEENRVLVISEYALEPVPYNEDPANVTWETCTMRSWLNHEFYNTAFTSEEQDLISVTTVKAHKNFYFNVDSGKDTQDKVFLLSIQEAEQYFTSDEARKCAPTTYAKAQGVDTSEDYKTASGEATCWWWLRSPGGMQDSAAGVMYNGEVDVGGYNVSYDMACVRPAMWIELETFPTTLEPTPTNAVNVGELVTFGTYEQNTDTEPIQWRVLAKEENRILVISEYALVARPYNEKDTDVTWETCTLRSWLNQEFYNTAFTPEEQAQILTTTVKTQNNPRYPTSTDPGEDTQDKVFLLSIQEAEEYFVSDEARRIAPTAYARARGAEYKEADGVDTCWWWLRSSGNLQDHAAFVYYDGVMGEGGFVVNYDGICVRPAMWIDLDM